MLSPSIKLLIYSTFLCPILATQVKRLNALQNLVLSTIIVSAPRFVSNAQIYRELEFPVLSDYAPARNTLERASRSGNPLIPHLRERDADQPRPRVYTRRILEMNKNHDRLLQTAVEKKTAKFEL